MFENMSKICSQIRLKMYVFLSYCNQKIFHDNFEQSFTIKLYVEMLFNQILQTVQEFIWRNSKKPQALRNRINTWKWMFIRAKKLHRLFSGKFSKRWIFNAISYKTLLIHKILENMFFNISKAGQIKLSLLPRFRDWHN